MRPAGVVSKKLIGERKIAKAIRSCSFRLACSKPVNAAHYACLAVTYLNRTEDPEYQRLHNDEGSRANTKSEVDPDVLAHVGVAAVFLVDLGPMFEPDACTCSLLASATSR
jgi:hypothetical protein